MVIIFVLESWVNTVIKVITSFRATKLTFENIYDLILGKFMGRIMMNVRVPY